MQKINDNLQKNTFKFVYEKSKTELKTKIGEKGITLIALIITTIFSYDENVKSSNNKGFLLQTI